MATPEKTTQTAKSKTDGKKTVKQESQPASMKELYSDGKASSKTAPEAGKKSAVRRGDAYRILLKPLITEKIAIMSEKGKYGFAVSMKANKIEISKAIEEVYGIKPEKVNIITTKGKAVRYGKVKGRRSDGKKAIVGLPKGKTIDVYEGV